MSTIEQNFGTRVKIRSHQFRVDGEAMISKVR